MREVPSVEMFDHLQYVPFSLSATKKNWLRDMPIPPAPETLQLSKITKWTMGIALVFAAIGAATTTVWPMPGRLVGGAITIVALVLFAITYYTKGTLALQVAIRNARHQEVGLEKELQELAVMHKDLETTYLKAARSYNSQMLMLEYKLKNLPAHLQQARQIRALAKAKDKERIEGELQALPRVKLKRIQALLQVSQKMFIDDVLDSHEITPAEVPGIGPQLCRSLTSNGFRKAADFVFKTADTAIPESGSDGTVLLTHRSGKECRVPGVGAAKAQSIKHWQLGLAVQAQREAPSQLSQAELATIDAEIETTRLKLLAHRDALNSALINSNSSKIDLKSELLQQRVLLQGSARSETIAKAENLYAARKAIELKGLQWALAQIQCDHLMKSTKLQVFGALIKGGTTTEP